MNTHNTSDTLRNTSIGTIVMALSLLFVQDASAKCAPGKRDCSCTRRAPTQPVTHPRDEARLQGAPQILDLENVAPEGPSGELKLMQDERTLRQLSQHSKQCLTEEVMASIVDHSLYMSFMPSSQPLGERLQANSTALNLIENSIDNKLGEEFSCRDMGMDEVQLLSTKARLYTCLQNPAGEGCNPLHDYLRILAKVPVNYHYSVERPTQPGQPVRLRKNYNYPNLFLVPSLHLPANHEELGYQGL